LPLHLDIDRTHLLNPRDARNALLNPSAHHYRGLGWWSIEPQFHRRSQVLASSGISSVHRTSEHTSHLIQAAELAELIETTHRIEPTGGALKPLHPLARLPRLAGLIAEHANTADRAPHDLAGIPILPQVTGIARNHAQVIQLDACLLGTRLLASLSSCASGCLCSSSGGCLRSSSGVCLSSQF
jgi:hypothetical protein